MTGTVLSEALNEAWNNVGFALVVFEHDPLKLLAALTKVYQEISKHAATKESTPSVEGPAAKRSGQALVRQSSAQMRDQLNPTLAELSRSQKFFVTPKQMLEIISLYNGVYLYKGGQNNIQGMDFWDGIKDKNVGAQYYGMVGVMKYFMENACDFEGEKDKVFAEIDKKDKFNNTKNKPDNIIAESYITYITQNYSQYESEEYFKTWIMNIMDQCCAYAAQHPDASFSHDRHQAINHLLHRSYQLLTDETERTRSTVDRMLEVVCWLDEMDNKKKGEFHGLIDSIKKSIPWLETNSKGPLIDVVDSFKQGCTYTRLHNSYQKSAATKEELDKEVEKIPYKIVKEHLGKAACNSSFGRKLINWFKWLTTKPSKLINEVEVGMKKSNYPAEDYKKRDITNPSFLKKSA